MCENGFLSRNRNGDKYWRSDFLYGKIEWEGLQLHDLCERDVQTLMDIHKSLGYYEDMAGEAFELEDAKTLIQKKDLPPNGCQEFFHAKMILTKDNQPAGYLVTYEGYPQQNTLWIGSLFLHSKYHRQGMGSKVIKALEDSAGNCGYETLGLGVYGQNYVGLQFWVKQGFCKIESVRAYKSRGILMRLSKKN